MGNRSIYVRRPLASCRLASENAEVEFCVATDLSPSADPAVQLALRWAERLGASVLLLHIVHDPELAPAFTGDVPGDVARARAALQLFAAGARVPCRVEVRTADRVAEAIVEASAACAYLFVGSHGKAGFQRLRLGSVATSVLQRSRGAGRLLARASEPLNADWATFHGWSVFAGSVRSVARAGPWWQERLPCTWLPGSVRVGPGGGELGA